WPFARQDPAAPQGGRPFVLKKNHLIWKMFNSLINPVVPYTVWTQAWMSPIRINERETQEACCRSWRAIHKEGTQNNGS
ncbi:hypothetical protein, partial [Pseudomonas protegens]|uniref:hypothetical protein n=1 Tax=Pseudomonas protegens TaxID=380021 RepID=UPI001C8300CD